MPVQSTKSISGKRSALAEDFDRSTSLPAFKKPRPPSYLATSCSNSRYSVSDLIADEQSAGFIPDHDVSASGDVCYQVPQDNTEADEDTSAAMVPSSALPRNASDESDREGDDEKATITLNSSTDLVRKLSPMYQDKYIRHFPHDAPQDIIDIFHLLLQREFCDKYYEMRAYRRLKEARKKTVDGEVRITYNAYYLEIMRCILEGEKLDKKVTQFIRADFPIFKEGWTFSSTEDKFAENKFTRTDGSIVFFDQTCPRFRTAEKMYRETSVDGAANLEKETKLKYYNAIDVKIRQLKSRCLASRGNWLEEKKKKKEREKHARENTEEEDITKAQSDFDWAELVSQKPDEPIDDTASPAQDIKDEPTDKIAEALKEITSTHDGYKQRIARLENSASTVDERLSKLRTEKAEVEKELTLMTEENDSLRAILVHCNKEIGELKAWKRKVTELVTQ
ncbi:hypothetical protein SUNI508_08069 [Seiridium unicorne]|uniref:Uncharacterized protein n=1 Tax=Seiridium unicorne TaxID=138068 RepID=A0ABR2UUJ0_9PEZI